MNRKIQKYTILQFGYNYTDLPSDAFFLGIYSNEGKVYVTFLIDEGAPKHKRTFYLAAASEILSDDYEFKYIGSTLISGLPAYLFEQKN